MFSDHVLFEEDSVLDILPPKLRGEIKLNMCDTRALPFWRASTAFLSSKTVLYFAGPPQVR